MVKVYSVNPTECFVFKSAIAPMCMSYNIKNFQDWQQGKPEPELKKLQSIFKNCDDIRQD